MLEFAMQSDGGQQGEEIELFAKMFPSASEKLKDLSRSITLSDGEAQTLGSMTSTQWAKIIENLRSSPETQALAASTYEKGQIITDADVLERHRIILFRDLDPSPVSMVDFVPVLIGLVLIFCGFVMFLIGAGYPPAIFVGFVLIGIGVFIIYIKGRLLWSRIEKPTGKDAFDQLMDDLRYIQPAGGGIGGQVLNPGKGTGILRES